MNKKIIIIGVSAFFSISIFVYLFFPVTKPAYLQIEDEKSNITINCRFNSDCMFIQVVGRCGGFESINKNNSETEIEKFNEKIKMLEKGRLINCLAPVSMENVKPVCKKGLCS